MDQRQDGRRLIEVQSAGLPVVAWGVPLPGLDLPVIGSDNRLGGRLVFAEDLRLEGALAALLALRQRVQGWLAGETLHGTLWQAGLPRHTGASVSTLAQPA